jgi:riboflavin synthase
MFTGIIEKIGEIAFVEKEGTNNVIGIISELAPELKIDQSIAHDGVCLTVTSIRDNVYTVVAIEETLNKTNLRNWKPGNKVNLERCLVFNGRIDGHLVQGHVDSTALCRAIDNRNGSWEFTFEIDPKFAHLLVEKGSVCINGISLTLLNVESKSFTVAIIPYTYENTNLHALSIGEKVNIEFDIIGKYLLRFQSLLK